MKQHKSLLLCTVILSFIFACEVMAAPVDVDIFGPGQRIIRLSMADALSEGGSDAPSVGVELNKLINENLSFLPFIRFVGKEAILGGTRLNSYKMPEIDLKRFQLAGSDLLITAGWASGGRTVELRVYETLNGNLVFGKAYSDIQANMLPKVADRFCSELMKALTGKGEFFLSTLSFIKKSGKNSNVWIVRPTGRDLKQISNLPGIAMSPAWSNDGRFIIFSQIDDRTHGLGVWDRMTQQVKRVKFTGNTVIGPTFMPDNRVAVGLAINDYPNIFMLDHSFKKQGLIEGSGGIDVSPSFDATGSKMAFTSSRLGNPHVFIKDMRTGKITRISMVGKYNTEPSISPDGTLVAFSRLTDLGHRIFVFDILTGMERQISFGPGRDEQASFCGDSYFVAFASTRSGTSQIYLTTRHGGEAKRVPTGDGGAAFPAWGIIPD